MSTFLKQQEEAKDGCSIIVIKILNFSSLSKRQ